MPDAHGLDADGALERLRAGNARYVAGRPMRFRLDEARRRELSTGQAPIASVFACIDSRVPVERVFDQGHGDLLVIRTAAHVLDQATLGSVEFGVEALGIPLIVVLGHEQCGAVAAAMRFADGGAAAQGSIQAVLDGIVPSLAAPTASIPEREARSTRQHSQRVAARLAASPVIGPAVAAGRVRVVAAYYAMRAGEVDFFDAVPPPP